MLQSISALSNTRYLELSLRWTLFDSFSILINFSNKSVWYLKLLYLEISLSRTRSLQSFLGCFPLAISNTVHFRHSNINNFIDKTLLGSLFFLFFNIVHATTGRQSKRNVKSLGEKCQASRDLEKGHQTKTLVKNMMYPVVKPSSIEVIVLNTNALNTLQNLCLFHKLETLC